MGNASSTDEIETILNTPLFPASESFKEDFWNKQWYPVQELKLERIVSYSGDEYDVYQGAPVPKNVTEKFVLPVYSTITKQLWNKKWGEYSESNWLGFHEKYIHNTRFIARNNKLEPGFVMKKPLSLTRNNFSKFDDKLEIKIINMSRDGQIAELSIQSEIITSPVRAIFKTDSNSLAFAEYSAKKIPVGTTYTLENFKNLGKFSINKKLFYDDFTQEEASAGCFISDLSTNIMYPIVLNSGQIYCISDIVDIIHNNNEPLCSFTRLPITSITIMNEMQIKEKELKQSVFEIYNGNEKLNKHRELKQRRTNMRKKRMIDNNDSFQNKRRRMLKIKF